MEKFKDFIYDISDLFISLIIIAVIFAVISWKLNETIPIDSPASKTTVQAPAPTADSGAVSEIQPQTPSTDASDADKPIGQPKTPSGTQAPSTATTPSNPTQPATPPAGSVSPGQAVSIDIPSGATGFAIGKILKDKGLISDINAFTARVQEMNLAPKLRSGTFQLKSGVPLDDLIKTLANVK